MKPPVWLERLQRKGGNPRAPLVAGRAAVDGIEATAAPDFLDEIEALVVDDEALQEIAEQTSYGEVLLEDLIRRQRRLAVGVAAVFLVLLLGLPLMNLFFADLLAVRVLGLPMSWLVLGGLIYPILWALGAYYVSTSKKYEDEFTDLVR